MHKHLELNGLVTVISNDNARAQVLRTEGDAVDDGEGERPKALGLVVKGHGREAEVELDRGVGRASGLRG